MMALDGFNPGFGRDFFLPGHSWIAATALVLAYLVISKSWQDFVQHCHVVVVRTATLLLARYLFRSMLSKRELIAPGYDSGPLSAR